MSRLLIGVCVALIVFGSCERAWSQDDESAGRKIAIEMTKTTVIAYLKDREFKLQGDELKTTARASIRRSM